MQTIFESQVFKMEGVSDSACFPADANTYEEDFKSHIEALMRQKQFVNVGMQPLYCQTKSRYLH